MIKNSQSTKCHTCTHTQTQYLDTVISFNSSYSTSDLQVGMIKITSTQAYTLTMYSTTVSELLLDIYDELWDQPVDNMDIKWHTTLLYYLPLSCTLHIILQIMPAKDEIITNTIKCSCIPESSQSELWDCP